MDASLADGVPFLSVIDLSEFPPFSAAPSVIPHLHEWVKTNLKQIDELTLSCGTVLKESFWSPFAKKIVDAVRSWLCLGQLTFLLTSQPSSRRIAKLLYFCFLVGLFCQNAGSICV